jgi:hypothetical protein
MTIRTLLLAAAALLTVTVTQAHACPPTPVGDVFKYKNGPALEVVKVSTLSCNPNLCIRPVGSTQPCYWVKESDAGIGATWIIEYGEVQPQP